MRTAIPTTTPGPTPSGTTPVPAPGTPAPTTTATTATGAGEWRRAVLDVAPLLVAYAPFAFVIGTTVAAAGPLGPRWASTPLVMGGSAQLAVLQLLDAGAGPALVVATAMALNARLLTYSATLAPDWAGRSLRFRLLAAATVIDPTWALAQRRAADDATPAQRHRYYVAMATVLCTGWVALVTAGAVVGDRVDASFAAVAVPMALFSLLAPRLGEPGGRPVAVVAVVVAVGGTALPAGAGVLAAVAGGVAAGELAHRRSGR